jgi:hypothetical protein
MQHVNVNSADIEYEVQGSGEPVVLIHGAQSSRMRLDAFYSLRAEPSIATTFAWSRITGAALRGVAEPPPRSPLSSRRRMAALCSATWVSRGRISQGTRSVGICMSVETRWGLCIPRGHRWTGLSSVYCQVLATWGV